MTDQPSPTTSEDPRPLAEQVAEIDWYHTFDLPGGVTTKGYFDLRKTVHKLPIPASLEGKRCLDVASADGFFAIEMAKRGGDVTSLDLADTTQQDWQGPPGINSERRQSTGRAKRAFEIASTANGVKINRLDGSLYDMDPADLGTFDYVFMGNVLMHLGDPGRALRAIRSVTKPDGEFCSFEGINLFLTVLSPKLPLAQLWDMDDPRWWTHNKAGHKRIVEAGGFEVFDSGGPFVFQQLGEFIPKRPDSWRIRPRQALFFAWTRPIGMPSSWMRARPRDLEGAEATTGR